MDDNEKSTVQGIVGERYRHDEEAISVRIRNLHDLLKQRAIPLDQEGEALNPPTFNDLIQELDALHRVLVAPYRLVVAGVQKSGKSTLVNLLLGENLFPMGMENVDGVLSQIAYGGSRIATVFTKSGEAREVEFEEGLKLIDQRKVEHERSAVGIDYVRFEIPNRNLQTFVLVNTPGLSDRPSVSQRTIDFFGEADAILWVFEAKRVQQAQIAGTVLELCHRHGTKILAVLNKRSEIDKEGRPGDIEAVEKAFKEVFAGCYEAYFWMDVRDAARFLGIIDSRGASSEQLGKGFQRSGYRELIDHFDRNFFGQDKRREKHRLAQTRFSTYVGQAVVRVRALEAARSAELDRLADGDSELSTLESLIHRTARRVDRDLRPIAEKYCQMLLDAYLRALPGVVDETFGILKILRSKVSWGETLEAEFERKLAAAVESRLPGDQLSGWIERDANGVMTDIWMEFPQALERITESPTIARPNARVEGTHPGRGVLISRTLQIAVKAAVASALKLGGQRLGQGVLKRPMQQAVRGVVRWVMEAIGKKFAVTTLKELGKKLNPFLWILAVADLENMRKEFADAFAKARADIQFEIEAQKGIWVEKLLDSLHEQNTEIRTQVLAEVVDKPRGSQATEKSKLEAAFSDLQQLRGSLEAIDTLKFEPVA